MFKDTTMNNKNELVVKSNRLVEASYRLTLAEQRIILFAIAEARRTQKGLSADDFVTIQAADYAVMFDIPLKQAYEQIKEATRTLFRRYVVLYDTHPASGKPRMTEVRWLSSASYIDGAGTIQLRFAQDMVPYITRLEAEFTRYKLEKVAMMSSAYAIRLYELLMQWGSSGQREIELEWLKKTLMVDSNYERLDNFKKWVIDVALAQINEYSDLTASYTQRKTGRNVTHLIFTFSPKEQPKPTKAKSKASEPSFLSREYIEKHAQPGESWQQAERRLKAKPAK
jgi:plasmid replication initiation protein